MYKSSLFLIILILLISFGCSENTPTFKAGETIDKLYSIKIIPYENRKTISISSTEKSLELMIKGTYSDGTEKMIDQTLADWSSKDGDSGVISIRGIFTATKKGKITIVAKIGLVKDEIEIEVIK